jgi:hypothetical protein
MQMIRPALSCSFIVALLGYTAMAGAQTPPPPAPPPPPPPGAGPSPQPSTPGNTAGTTPSSPAEAAKATEEGAKEEEKAGDEEANTAEELRQSRRGLGMEPGALSFGDLVLPPPPGSQITPAAVKAGQINFHGYLRAPLLIGLGSGKNVPDGVDRGLKLHAPPRIPDAAYTDWKYTNNLGGPWTELQFIYGNARVFGTVQVASYNLTDASFKDLTAQLGINQAFVTINMPDFFGDRGGGRLNIGGFSDGYGASGRYDAGAYGTYLFGRTHTTGYTASVFYDVTDQITAQIEQGFGARLNVFPYAPNGPMAPFLPYGGPKQQLPTFLHHAHVGATYADKYTLALHYITSWTAASESPMELDGRITTVGAELRAVDTRYGSGWLGFSHLSSKNPVRVAGAMEVIHSWEGWSLTENFFGEPDISSGTGTVNTLGWEYSFSLATLLRYPESFYGQAPDLLVSIFGMYSSISSPDPTFVQLAVATAKLKAGTEITYTPLRWLGTGVRFDVVQPNMKDSRESFTEISPRLLLHTDFISNEQIILQYTHYWLGSRTRLSFPFDQTKVTPDENVLSLIATLWW